MAIFIIGAKLLPETMMTKIIDAIGVEICIFFFVKGDWPLYEIIIIKITDSTETKFVFVFFFKYDKPYYYCDDWSLCLFLW